MAGGVGIVREDPERRRRLAGNEETKRGIESPRNRETRKREEDRGDERTKSQRGCGTSNGVEKMEDSWVDRDRDIVGRGERVRVALSRENRVAEG